jgi:hypothetical protein
MDVQLDTNCEKLETGLQQLNEQLRENIKILQAGGQIQGGGGGGMSMEDIQKIMGELKEGLKMTYEDSFNIIIERLEQQHISQNIINIAFQGIMEAVEEG